MTVMIEVNKCSDCPYYYNRYEFGVYTNCCTHKEASKEINEESAYNNVGNNRLPTDKISYKCPIKKEKGE